MTVNRFVWIPFWVLILLMIIGTMLIYNVKAEYDCLDYALASGEPVILVGKHPYFYGSLDSGANHFLNYEIVDNHTLIATDYKTNATICMYLNQSDEIRPGVYYNGFNYFKLFIYREPQRYWRKMI